MALLQLLHDSARRSHWRLTVAHLNHGIRGKASDDDAAFVANAARRLRIPCVMGKVRVPVLAKRRGVSLEMAARDARYAFLVRMARKVKADRIVTAHHADDQVETMLLKLVRGAGRGGLSGMAELAHIEGIPLVRPLLSVSRSEIESLVRARKIPWREDESNRDTDYLLPFLEREFNPRIREAVLRTGAVLGAEDEWMDGMARGMLEECGRELTCGRLRRYPLAARRRVIRLWLAGQGVPVSGLDFEGIARVEALVGSSQGSKAIDLADGWRIHRQYDRLLVRKPDPESSFTMNPVRVKVPGITVVKDLGLRITVALAPGIVKDKGGGPGRFPARASVNAQVWANRPLWIRACQAGDRLAPFGMKGARKIQDVLVDAKVPRADRPRLPVLDCEGAVVWLPGYRISREWAVENAQATNIQVVVEKAL